MEAEEGMTALEDERDEETAPYRWGLLGENGATRDQASRVM
jgi:hypothetical protein